jgi:hypothetical protein
MPTSGRGAVLCAHQSRSRIRPAAAIGDREHRAADAQRRCADQDREDRVGSMPRCSRGAGQLVAELPQPVARLVLELAAALLADAHPRRDLACDPTRSPWSP